ncbi:hypothetical protein RUM43_000473 [Polyplax serrata]|uniref:BTB domain-containing protein n=1 Tax=Polyplax serrata TaxID=468196 RepID=A0AAN8SG13_POLSC
MSYSNCQFTWLKQRETLVSLAESLLKEETFFDCQLCAEGHRFNVHRVILSCNSPVLNNILQEHNSDLPVITLEGVSSVEVAALVEFMYTGVTKIAPSYLKNFFQTARSLQLAGLTHYDSAQVNKIINETGSSAGESEVQDNYEAYSQNILKYLDQSEPGDEPQSRELTSLGENVESIFLDESSEQSTIVNSSSVIYEKYDSSFIKEDEGIESLDPNLVEGEGLSPTQATDEASTIEGSETDTPLIYNKFHGIFIKNEDDSMNDGVTTVYSISKLDDIGEKDETDMGELQEELKVTEEDENFVYVKLDNSSLVKVKESDVGKGKQTNISKNDMKFYTEKCLRVINPVEKNYLVKRPKIQSLVQKDVKTNSSTEDKKIYICLKCGNKYSHRRTLLHHIHWICEQPATYSCSLCPYRGKRKFQLKSHMKHAHLLKMS